MPDEVPRWGETGEEMGKKGSVRVARGRFEGAGVKVCPFNRTALILQDEPEKSAWEMKLEFMAY